MCFLHYLAQFVHTKTKYFITLDSEISEPEIPKEV